MIFGIFGGASVTALTRAVDRLDRLRGQVKEKADQAIADRYAAIREAQSDIDTIRTVVNRVYAPTPIAS